MRTLCTLTGGHSAQIQALQESDGRCHFLADADIDADGSPRAYAPGNHGLDDLANARDGSSWCGIAVDSHGLPYIQGPTDPCPGFYVSTTAYQWPGKLPGDPRRYVDAEAVPFIVLSPLLRVRADRVVLGCKARATNTRTGQSVDAVVADIGPRYKCGELSIAAAKAIGIPWSARSGGTSDNIVLYEFWPGQPAVIAGVTYNLIPAHPV